MNEEKLSVRQLSVAAFTGGLAPAVAGAGYGWQGALLALPVLLLAGWGFAALAPRWSAMARSGAGKTLAVLYALWGAALLARGLGRCVRRILATGGSGMEMAPWIILLLAVPLVWMARGKPAAFFRAAEIFYLAVAIIAAALLLWGAFHVNWEYVLRPAESLWTGFWAALETGGFFLYILPYINRSQIHAGDGRRAVKWLAVLSVGTVLIALVTAGALSPALAAAVEEPFFIMTAALGSASRVEGLASALWLLADLIYLGLLARSWHWSGTDKSWLPAAAVVIGAAAACFGITELLPEAVWAVGTIILGAVTCLILLAAGKNSGLPQKRKTISCGVFGRNRKKFKKSEKKC